MGLTNLEQPLHCSSMSPTIRRRRSNLWISHGSWQCLLMDISRCSSTLDRRWVFPVLRKSHAWQIWLRKRRETGKTHLRCSTSSANTQKTPIGRRRLAFEFQKLQAWLSPRCTSGDGIRKTKSWMRLSCWWTSQIAPKSYSSNSSRTRKFGKTKWGSSSMSRTRWMLRVPNILVSRSSQKEKASREKARRIKTVEQPLKWTTRIRVPS